MQQPFISGNLRRVFNFFGSSTCIPRFFKITCCVLLLTLFYDALFLWLHTSLIRQYFLKLGKECRKAAIFMNVFLRWQKCLRGICDYTEKTRFKVFAFKMCSPWINKVVGELSMSIFSGAKNAVLSCELRKIYLKFIKLSMC